MQQKEASNASTLLQETWDLTSASPSRHECKLPPTRRHGDKRLLSNTRAGCATRPVAAVPGPFAVPSIRPDSTLACDTEARIGNMSNADLVVVRTFQNKIEAEIAQGALEAAEIESIVSADDAGGMRPDLARGGGVRLLVRVEDAEEAGKILDESKVRSICSNNSF
jgi:putative signal transducing protein